jgi:hypothetical protein
MINEFSTNLDEMGIFVISKDQTFRICVTFQDLAKFYILVIHLIQIQETCPAGLSFNRVTSRCENASNVDCTVDTCLSTWNVTEQQHLVANAPDYKDCSSFHLCVKGVSTKILNCGDGNVFDITQTTDVNNITFPGKCARKATDSTAQCFNGQNWKVPDFPAKAS